MREPLQLTLADLRFKVTRSGENVQNVRKELMTRQAAKKAEIATFFDGVRAQVSALENSFLKELTDTVDKSTGLLDSR